ncbi:MAG: phosphate signaling complex protein PhoU [Bacteroidota bacterium]|nr:phosphate signaling complex protein PhoU [Candidatus Kapabacteria bacterium]MDW8220565.1 phosphate signaling complex protein PhoU [Bacteroidota bacterium]
MHRSFEDSLDKLRTRLIRMGSIVEEQVEFSFRAVLKGDEQIAQLVMERDDKVDKLDMKIDKQCQKIFALHQPVASDLRLLLAALKINNELERIGDLAFNIARNLIEQPQLPELAEKLGLERLTQGVHTMVKGSLDAFVNNDPELAYQIMRTDNHIDTLTREIFDETVALMKRDGSVIETAVGILMVLRNLERMADQASNICENVIFLVEAKLVRATHAENGPPFQTDADRDED